ncbi:hypothetical protein AQUCO_01700767v1, partial [Aquilegia coerulea]
KKKKKKGNRVSTKNVDIAWKDEKKSAAIFPELEEDGVDNQFDIESWSDGGDCMWLFSDTKSPSLTSTDHLLIERMSSWLSMSRSLSFSSIIKEESLLLERKTNYIACQEDKEHAGSWVLDSKWNGLEEMSAGSSNEQSSYKDCNSSWTSLSTDEDYSSWIWDVDNVGFCDDLSDIVTGWDIFKSVLPSPLHMNRLNSLTRSSNSCVSSLTEENYDSLSCDLLSETSSETTFFGDLDNNCPLFWPSESQFSWNSEVLFDCFCISPRRVGSEVEKSENLCSPKSVILRLHSRKFKDRKEELISTRSKVVNKNTRRFSAMPSKLSITSQASMQTRPLEIENIGLEEQRKSIPTNVLTTDCTDLLQKCFLQDSDLSIESLVGLNEFDGHEGIDEDFQEDNFFLDETKS